MEAGTTKLERQTEQAWSRHAVLQCIIDLVACGHAATRDSICGHTGLPMVRVDSFIKDLKTDQLIRVIKNGQYEPVSQEPPSAISGTITPSGTYKLEKNGVCMEFTMREVRYVAALTGGVAQLFGR